MSPENEGEGPLLPELFGERIELPGGNHADAPVDDGSGAPERFSLDDLSNLLPEE